MLKCPKCVFSKTVKNGRHLERQRYKRKSRGFQFTRITPRGRPASEKAITAKEKIFYHFFVKTLRNKHDDVVLYLLTYHGVICHQARDLFSAGSVANPQNDDEGGLYIERALKLVENEMREAALKMEDALFVEYWGESVPPEQRIRRWLEKADSLATDWIPSASLFLDCTRAD